MNAFMASELVMKGIKSNSPFDEVLLAVKEVGESMEEKYRETALGGIAATKTAKAIEKRIFQDN
jgi:L-serine dehydratase